MICGNIFVFLLIIGSSLSHNIVIREITFNNEGGRDVVIVPKSEDETSEVPAETSEGSGSGTTEPPLVPNEETLDVSMTFNQTWSEDLTNTSSQAYQDAVAQANSALVTMTGWEGADLSGVTWTFTEGSVVATATVPVFGSDTAADVEARLAAFDTSTIPGLTGVTGTAPVTACSLQNMPTNGGTVTCTGEYPAIGSVCSFTCSNGTYLEGAAELTCGDDGNWNDAAPVCNDDPPPTTTTTTTTLATTTTTEETTTAGSSATTGVTTVLLASTMLALLLNALF